MKMLLLFKIMDWSFNHEMGLQKRGWVSEVSPLQKKRGGGGRKSLAVLNGVTKSAGV